MSWEYPCHRADVTGKQILTKEKPIGKAYGALQELQEKVPVAADVQISGLEVTQAYVANNTLVLRGLVRQSYPSSGGTLEERVAALEAAAETLTRNLTAATNRIAALENALANMTISLSPEIYANHLRIFGQVTAGSYGATNSDDGGVEVESC